MLYSQLLDIEGIGENKAKELLLSFKTIDRIKNASIRELKTVKGISDVNAQKIYEFFRH